MENKRQKICLRSDTKCRQSNVAILRQESGWFDKSENSAGSLCARLASDASNVHGVGNYLSVYI